ncbi:MAG: ribonuclease H [Chloroflexota bacterium]|nr:MAG: ribonuclease H [Chloroflexota bacterium]
MSKFYVVWKGRKTGVFSTWAECSAQVSGYSGAKYKSFPNRAFAEKAFQGDYADYQGQNVQNQAWLFAVNGPKLDTCSVDAACSGNPGTVEYRGVRTETGAEIFRQGPFAHGTNNIGEFLALVHALALFKKQGDPITIYSDSKIAMGWVRKKKCGTNLSPSGKNAKLFELIKKAENWLRENEYPNKIIKWDTEAWGEIPADFGRK